LPESPSGEVKFRRFDPEMFRGYAAGFALERFRKGKAFPVGVAVRRPKTKIPFEKAFHL
jgi:hypothetical protein